MSDAEIIDKMQTIIGALVRKKDLVLYRETVAGDVDGWDSLSHALIVLRLEKAFDIRFDDADLGRVQSVGELVDLVKSTRKP